ncbi:MAG: Uma2 family endonuclease [Prosthecobacter sp.]|uniref:Uma2 family endonuclease n=1 Tax=Prosthecobacter sp. TaxID=1965333 RepID=UPI003BAE1E96
MNSAILQSLLDSPALPELVEEGQKALAREQKLREKFYADITPEHKWEFIQGEVIMHSPALNRHLLATKQLYDVMNAYVRVKKLGVVHIEKAMCSFPRNDYEPDISFFGLTKARLTGPDMLRFPIPDLIIEVLSPSTEERDRGIKFQDYAMHGVAEYWIIDPVADSVELYRLAGDVYPPTERQTEGLLSSDAIAGFEIPVRAIFDEGENLRVQRQILTGA